MAKGDIHPRTKKVSKAKTEMHAGLMDVMEKHDLTFIETTQCLIDLIASLAKYALRNERHPNNPDYPADLE